MALVGVQPAGRATAPRSPRPRAQALSVHLVACAARRRGAPCAHSHSTALEQTDLALATVSSFSVVGRRGHATVGRHVAGRPTPLVAAHGVARARGCARRGARAVPCRSCSLVVTLAGSSPRTRHAAPALCPCPRRACSQAPCRRVAAPPSVWLPGAAAAPLRAPLAPACVGVGGRARLTATLPPAASLPHSVPDDPPPQPHTRAARRISKFRERAMAPGELLRAGGGAWQASVGAGVVRSRRKIGVGGQARGGGVTAAGGGAAGTSRSQTRPRVGAKARRVSGVGARHGAAQQAARGRLP